MPICPKFTAAIGKLRNLWAIQPLLLIAEEAYPYFPESSETITTSVFIAIQKIDDEQALLPHPDRSVNSRRTTLFAS